MERPADAHSESARNSDIVGDVTPISTSKEYGKGSVEVNAAAESDKEMIRTPQEVLLWRGRSRRFSLGIPRQAMESTPVQHEIHLSLEGLSVWQDAEKKLSPMELQERDLSAALGVGHVKAPQEDLYFHCLCGSLDSESLNTTSRDRIGEDAERAASMSAMISQRYSRASATATTGSADILRLLPRGSDATPAGQNTGVWSAKSRQGGSQPPLSAVGHHRGIAGPSSQRQTRSRHISRSLSAPYFHSWSFGNIDVSHQVRNCPT